MHKKRQLVMLSFGRTSEAVVKCALDNSMPNYSAGNLQLCFIRSLVSCIVAADKLTTFHFAKGHFRRSQQSCLGQEIVKVPLRFYYIPRFNNKKNTCGFFVPFRCFFSLFIKFEIRTLKPRIGAESLKQGVA